MTADEIKSLIKSTEYYNRYDKANHWDNVAVLAGRPMQSAEFNEIQNIAEGKIQAIGNALYEQGTLIQGCGISWNSTTKTATLEAGQIFLDGLIYDVEAKSLAISDPDNIQIGVWKIASILTEYNDNSLIDPAKGTPQYKMPGAYRVVVKTQWGTNTAKFDNAEFLPIYAINDGKYVVRVNLAYPAYMDVIARYDRHAHGSYIVEGLEATVVNSVNDIQTFKISEGLAHIDGYETELIQKTSLSIRARPDLAEIKDEPYSFIPDSSGKMEISVEHTPLEIVSRVRVTKERTVNLTHGSAGCIDVLPNDLVFQILEVKQGALIFVQDTDFTLNNDGLDWSLSGEEPTAGTIYSVTYYYRANVEPDSYDKDSVTVSGLFDNSLVEVTYSYRMPRKDIIVMYRESKVDYVRGVSASENPVAPDTPENAITVAEVTQTWNGLPIITSRGRRLG